MGALPLYDFTGHLCTQMDDTIKNICCSCLWLPTSCCGDHPVVGFVASKYSVPLCTVCLRDNSWLTPSTVCTSVGHEQESEAVDDDEAGVMQWSVSILEYYADVSVCPCGLTSDEVGGIRLLTLFIHQDERMTCHMTNSPNSPNAP